ncbi:MAG: glycogen debranching protein GlgX, partial [Nocardioides sp.]
EDPEILAQRKRQVANLMASLCLSSGSVMITAGDERGRTQHGNNNAYCQDNELSWMDWRPDDAWLDVYEVTKAALRLRREHPVLRQRHHFQGTPTMAGGPKDLAWIHPTGREMTEPDWFDTGVHTLGMLLSGSPLRSPSSRGEQQHDKTFLIWLNSLDQVDISLPQVDAPAKWEVVLSTSSSLAVGDQVTPEGPLTIKARSILVLRES